MGSAAVAAVLEVRDLNILVGSALLKQTQVCLTVSRCFAKLHQLHSVHRLVPTSTFRSLVTNLHLSQVDCGKSILFGALIRRLQSTLNACSSTPHLQHPPLQPNNTITDALINWSPLVVGDGKGNVQKLL